MRLNEKGVIDEYRGADFTRRLHIYLQFPRLRSEFMAIDRNDLNRKSDRNHPGRDFSPAALVHGLLRSAVGCLKGLSGISCGHAPRRTYKS
jgi:hypothetical protein